MNEILIEQCSYLIDDALPNPSLEVCTMNV